MPTPTEGTHKERVVYGQRFEVYPLVWPCGGLSWEVLDAQGEMLTMDGSFDNEPTDDEIRALRDVGTSN